MYGISYGKRITYDFIVPFPRIGLVLRETLHLEILVITLSGVLLLQVLTRFLSLLQWHHNGSGGISNHQPRHCLLNRLFRRRSKKTPKLRVTGLCAGNSPVAGEFPVQMTSNAGVSFRWRHHARMDNYSAYFSWCQFVMNFFHWLTPCWAIERKQPMVSYVGLVHKLCNQRD